MSKTIRIGIELDHVIRDVNRQIVKYYQRDFDESIDMDAVDYKSDVIRDVCSFKSRREIQSFLYEDYALEVFGHAGQVSRNLSRDINMWIASLENQEEYDVEIFLYSMREEALTIQSTYFFLSKIASRVRNVVFPKTMEELSSYGDVFITADGGVIRYMSKTGKPVIMIRMGFNREEEKLSSIVYDSLRDFLDDDGKLNKIVKLTDSEWQERTRKPFWTSMLSWISSLLRRKSVR